MPFSSDFAVQSFINKVSSWSSITYSKSLPEELTGDTGKISQADAVRQLNLNEGAVKVAIHRLRRRFRELIKNEIGQTVSDSALVEEELHYLLETLS